MMDEHDRRLRQIRPTPSQQDDGPVEVDSSAFFAEPAPPPVTQPAPPSSPVQPPEPPRMPKRGIFMLILQAILSVAALVQLARTQMLPMLYLAVLAVLLVLLWFVVWRCQRYRHSFIAHGVSLLLSIALAAGCVYAQQGLTALDNITAGEVTGAEAHKVTLEPFVVYLSGVDTRGALTENSRSDVNILAVVNPETKQVALINTPRDYYVDLAGTSSKDKLTHAGMYGVQTSMDTLGNLYGVKVDHFVRINFAGFISIVDAIGGVDVYSDQAFTSVGSPGYYDPTTFAEGWNHLDGKAALAFARERHAFATGDIQRGINQMKVIDAMLSKLKSPSLLMSFSKLMDAVSDCFVTSFSQAQISALVRMQLADFAEWQIQSYTATGTSGSSTHCYSAQGQKLYIMKPDENSVNEARALAASVLGGQLSADSSSSSAAQPPEKTDVHTPTADPNAAVPVPEPTPDSVILEQPAEPLPESEASSDSEAAPPVSSAPSSEAASEPSAESPAAGAEEAPGPLTSIVEGLLGMASDTASSMLDSASDEAA